MRSSSPVAADAASASTTDASVAATPKPSAAPVRVAETPPIDLLHEKTPAANAVPEPDVALAAAPLPPSTAPVLSADASSPSSPFPKVSCAKVTPYLSHPILAGGGAGASMYAAGTLLEWGIPLSATLGAIIGVAHGYVQVHYVTLPAAYPDSAYAVSEFTSATTMARPPYSRKQNAAESSILTLSAIGEMLGSGFDAAFKSGGYLAPGIVAAYLELISHTRGEGAKLTAESGVPVDKSYFGVLSNVLTFNAEFIYSNFIDIPAMAVEFLPLLRAGVVLSSGYTVGTIAAAFVAGFAVPLAIPPLLVAAGVAAGSYSAKSEFDKSKYFERKLMQQSIKLPDRLKKHNCIAAGLYYLTKYTVVVAGKLITVAGDMFSVCIRPAKVISSSATVSGICEGVTLGVEGRDTLVQSLPFMEPVPMYALVATGVVATVWSNLTSLKSSLRQAVNGQEVGVDVALEAKFTQRERETTTGAVAQSRFCRLFCCCSSCGRRPQVEDAPLVSTGIAPTVLIRSMPVTQPAAATVVAAVPFGAPNPPVVLDVANDEDDIQRPSRCTQFWSTITCGFFCSTQPKQAQSAAAVAGQYKSLGNN